MTQVETPTAERQLRHLRRRAARIAEVVEVATRSASDPTLRREGAKLCDVLDEWLDELRDLVDAHSEGLGERMESFGRRIQLAETKIEGWKLPPELVDALSRRTGPKGAGARGRRTHRRAAA